jgi:hypothetical protein
MRLYNEAFLSELGPALGGDPISFIGLGAYDFQLASGKLHIQNMLRVDFCLQGVEYTWESGPCACPAWLLIGQTLADAVLESPTALRLILASGDWVRLHTDDSAYESQTFRWSSAAGEPYLEIF